MYKEIWNKVLFSICRIDLKGELGYTVKTYTAFKIKELLVTSLDVFNNNIAKEVEITFFEDGGFVPKAKIRINYLDFVSELQAGPKDNKWGFGIIIASFLSEYKIDPVNAMLDENVSIGTEIAVIGAGNHDNLIMQRGVVTGKYIKDGILKIENDIQVPSSFVGAPVFNVQTGSIIGTVSADLSEAESAFKQIQDISNSNILRLKAVTESLIVDDIDIVQVLQVNQQQIKHFSSILLKYLNVKESVITEIKGLATFTEAIDFVAHENVVSIIKTHLVKND